MSDIRLVNYCNNKAVKIYVGKYTLFFSYETLVAFRKDNVTYRSVCDDDIDNVISNTTSRHLNEMLGENKASYKKLPYKELKI